MILIWYCYACLRQDRFEWYYPTGALEQACSLHRVSDCPEANPQLVVLTDDYINHWMPVQTY